MGPAFKRLAEDEGLLMFTQKWKNIGEAENGKSLNIKGILTFD